MHIPFPVEVFEVRGSDPEFAEAARDYLAEMQPAMVRQALYFSIAYPIMWVSILATSCYITAKINWWYGYGYFVFLALCPHLLFRYGYVGAMNRVNIAERLAAYAACFFYRTVIVCTFAFVAITGLVSVAYLYNSLAPLMRQPSESAAVQSVEGQPVATNVVSEVES